MKPAWKSYNWTALTPACQQEFRRISLQRLGAGEGFAPNPSSRFERLAGGAIDTMTTRRIPRDQWVPFLDQFSRNHGGWLARVEVLGDQIGAQTEAANLPLLGVSADVKDQAHSIAVALGHDPASHLTHEIEGVKELWIEEVDEGHETLQVASDSGVTTLLHVSLDDPAQIPS